VTPTLQHYTRTSRRTSYYYKDQKRDQESDSDAARDAYAMSHNSTLQNLTASAHALLLRPSNHIYTAALYKSIQFIGRPQQQAG